MPMPTMLTLQILVAHHVGGAQLRHDLVLQQLHRARQSLRHGEAEVGLAVLADVLDDHVDFDVGVGHGPRIW
jgi:UPF0716 family protein affecting phage T7 exclusion